MNTENPDLSAPYIDAQRLRRIVLIVALLNFAYFFVDFGVALAAESVSLLADSVDFLEDTAINLLILIASDGTCPGKHSPARRWPWSSWFPQRSQAGKLFSASPTRLRRTSAP